MHTCIICSTRVFPQIQQLISMQNIIMAVSNALLGGLVQDTIGHCLFTG